METSNSMHPSLRKIKTLEEIVEIAEKAHQNGDSVVTTNGCFDILHSGHVDNLEWCKGQGQILIVGVNSDESVRTNKDPKRPINAAEDRARVLAGQGAVDYVFIFDTDGPIPWIERIKPNVHVKGAGAETHPKFQPEEKAVKRNGGEVRLAPKIEGRSTTDNIETILTRYCAKRKE